MKKYFLFKKETEEKLGVFVLRLLIIIVPLFFLFGIVQYFYGEYDCYKNNLFWVANPPLRYGGSVYDNYEIYKSYNVRSSYVFGFCAESKK
ncbi:MAG: hypothetical protein WCF92_03150 [bacterium]